jgi:hypothetical protein
MKLSARSYPYPVVGNRDDVPGAGFQATVEMSSDKESVYIDAAINSSSVTVNRLVAEGAAKFVVHVECSNTLFRQAFEFAETSKRIAIPTANLNDAVEVNVFARAARQMPGYRVDAAHSDYGDAEFDIREGDVLAVGEGHVFHIESSFDSLSRIGSIMQIEEAKDDGDLPLRVDFNTDKILIILSKSDFADYKLLKNTEGVSAALTITIVLPVLIEALHLLKSEDNDYEDESELRWARALRRRITALELDSESDYLILAQKLLELPMKRALVAARQLAEASS